MQDISDACGCIVELSVLNLFPRQMRKKKLNPGRCSLLLISSYLLFPSGSLWLFLDSPIVSWFLLPPDCSSALLEISPGSSGFSWVRLAPLALPARRISRRVFLRPGPFVVLLATPIPWLAIVLKDLVIYRRTQGDEWLQEKPAGETCSIKTLGGSIGDPRGSIRDPGGFIRDPRGSIRDPGRSMRDPS